MIKYFFTSFCILSITIEPCEIYFQDFDFKYEQEKKDLDYLYYKSYLNHDFIQKIQMMVDFVELFPDQTDVAMDSIKTELFYYKQRLQERNYQQYE